MNALLRFGSKCSVAAAAFCVILALLSAPQNAKADQMDDCQKMCYGLDLMSGEWSDCINSCMASGGCPQQTCSSDCDASNFPKCGNGKCDKKDACTKVPCSCKIIYISEKADHCECSGANSRQLPIAVGRNMLRNFVGTLSMAISSVGSSGATDDHWRSRFESEAPPAWHQYQMRNQFAQGQVLGEKTHTVYKKNEICRSVQITTVASGASELFAENASYSFHLKKASADKDWLLVSIVMKFDGESDSGGLIQTRLEMYSTLSDEAIRLDPDHKYLYDLVSSPRSKLQGVSPRTVNNATLVEVRFLVDPDPSDKRLLTDFTLLLDPSRNWIPLTTSAKVRNRAGVGTHTNEFTYAPGVFPLLQRSLNGQEYDLIGQTEKWKSVADETWDFQVPPRLPKDEEFMLSTYGLPEPVGLAKRKANPIYIWFIACACLFVGIAVCLRYLTYMRERRLRSPHKAQS